MKYQLSKRKLSTWALAVTFLFGAVTGLKTQAADRNAPIKVMSFNIRYGAANDGENSWKHRDYLVLETIENYLAKILPEVDLPPYPEFYR